jgi:hypothetical protein
MGFTGRRVTSYEEPHRTLLLQPGSGISNSTWICVPKYSGTPITIFRTGGFVFSLCGMKWP